MSQSGGWEPIASKRAAGNELGDHFKVARTQEQAERSRRVSEGMNRRRSFWKRLFRKR